LIAGGVLASIVMMPATDGAATTTSTAPADEMFFATEGEVAAPDRSRVRAAVGRGLEYLRRSQDRTTGGWVQDVGFKFNSDYQRTALSKPHVGVTSLALMAFLSGGHLPSRGRHGDVVQRGTDFILASVDPDSGYISRDGTRMYSHAYATLFLAEIFGMTHRADVKEKLQRAVDLTVKAQNEHGSWRYNPFSPESDMSITVCQIMALRAARNIGIRVPKATVKRAVSYVERSAYSNPSSSDYGGFKYQEKGHARTSFSITSAGVATLNHAGTYDSDLIKAGISYLRSEMMRQYRHYKWHFFFWYGHYYAAQVFFFAGDSNNEQWKWYWSRISRMLLEGQQADGSWRNSIGPGPAFSTAVASIILQVPNQYLPIFHR